MLREALINSLMQISEILEATNNMPKDKASLFYIENNAGKHIRHIMDHFLAFIPAVDNGVLDYNHRNRDSVIEQDWNAAQTQLEDIIQDLKSLTINQKYLLLISEVNSCDTVNQSFNSNVAREVLYLINHTMHHAAYIKLVAKGRGITLPEHIGIAPATATHLRKTGS